MMGTMFISPNRPFYQSVTVMGLPLIELDKYTDFCALHFRNADKAIDSEVVEQVYAQFQGVTFYLQKVMNILFMRTEPGGHCTLSDLQPARARKRVRRDTSRRALRLRLPKSMIIIRVYPFHPVSKEFHSRTGGGDHQH